MVAGSCLDPKSRSPPAPLLLQPASPGQPEPCPAAKTAGTTELAAERLDTAAPVSPGCLQLLSQPQSLATAPHICIEEQLGRGERRPRSANELGLFSFFAFAEPGRGPSRAPEDQEICESHSCLWAE